MDLVLQSILGLPSQFVSSWNQATSFRWPEDYKTVSNVLVSGMGGSRFPAFIIQELFKEELKIPLLINSEYRLPFFVDKRTLFIASSYSGTTEETIFNMKAAKEKNAKVTGVTTGGEVATFLYENALPSLVFDPKHNPSGQPRMGFGYAFAAILGILYSLGFLKIEKEKIEKAFSDLKEIIESLKEPAKKMAENLREKYPTIVTAEFLGGCANAMANQFNETAKTNSNFRLIPELNHHLMEGLKHPQGLHDFDVFVFFYSELYSEQIKKRFLITKDIVEQNGLKTLVYKFQGKDKISQALEFLAFSSLMTMFLSEIYHEDPTAIPFVDYFKKRMRE